MIKLTDSMKEFLWKYHSDIIHLILLGHVELFTEEMQQEYYEFLKNEYKKGS